MAKPLWQQPILRELAGDTLRPGGLALTERAGDEIALAPRQLVLDVGAGLGATVAALRRRYGVYAYGVDASSQQLAQGRKRHLLGATAEKLPFTDHSFHALFAECVLSILPQPELAIAEFSRVLRPGASLVLTDLYSTDERAMPTAHSCSAGAFSLVQIRQMLQSQGFEISLCEDHSYHLRQLAAELLFASDASKLCGRARGYYLLIAKRRI